MEFFAEALSLKAKIRRERVSFAQDELALAFTLLDFAKITQCAWRSGASACRRV